MAEPKKETISEKEFKAEEAEREKRFNMMLQRIKYVSPSIASSHHVTHGPFPSPS